MEHASKGEFAALQAQLDRGELPSDVVALHRSNNGHVRVERVGQHVRNEDGEVVEQISVYYVILDHYEPIVGPPGIQDRVGANHFLREDDATASAKRHQSYYHHYLTWSALIENLRLNGLATDTERFQYELHYRFLSAYTHPTEWGYERIRRGVVGLMGHSFEKDAHILGELTLLYVAHIGATELEALARYCDARDRLQLGDEDAVRNVIDTARAASADLWFPPAAPATWDLDNEANQRSFNPWAERDDEPYEPIRPEDVDPSEVAPVPDQIERLVRLHVPERELVTGNTYVPSWWPTT